MRNHIFRRPGMAGDTIVEVMISMVVLGLVMATAFVTSRHSLQSGLQASYRDQAVSYARQQVELIKQLDDSGSLSNYHDPKFCIQPPSGGSGPTKQGVNVTTGLCTLPVASPSPSQYSVVDKYGGDCDAVGCRTYTVEVQWPSSDANYPNQVSLQYKPRTSFVTTSGSFNPPVSNPVTLPPPGWVQLTTNKSTLKNGTGQKAKLKWKVTLVVDHCTGTSTPADAGWDGSKDVGTGSYQAQPDASTNYKISCYDASGTLLGDASVDITVEAAAPTVTLTAKPVWEGICFSTAGTVGCPSTDTCISMNESADPDSWSDNYICWPPDRGLNLHWSSAGPIDGETCTPIFEGADPHTWWDNYLCASKDYQFRWSSSGKLAGMFCGPFNALPDPDTWTDNFLCEPQYGNTYGNDSVDLSWTSTNADSCSSDWGGGGTGATGSDHLFGLDPDQTKTFTVTCTSAAGETASDSASVKISPAVDQPACTGTYCSASSVTFYQDVNYGGSSWSFSPETDCSWVENCGVPNDTVSSLKVSNACVTIYWDINYGTGVTRALTYSSDASTLRDGQYNVDWNDRMSSFKVMPRSSC